MHPTIEPMNHITRLPVEIHWTINEYLSNKDSHQLACTSWDLYKIYGPKVWDAVKVGTQFVRNLELNSFCGPEYIDKNFILDYDYTSYVNFLDIVNKNHSALMWVKRAVIAAVRLVPTVSKMENLRHLQIIVPSNIDIEQFPAFPKGLYSLDFRVVPEEGEGEGGKATELKVVKGQWLNKQLTLLANLRQLELSGLDVQSSKNWIPQSVESLLLNHCRCDLQCHTIRGRIQLQNTMDVKIQAPNVSEIEIHDMMMNQKLERIHIHLDCPQLVTLNVHAKNLEITNRILSQLDLPHLQSLRLAYLAYDHISLSSLATNINVERFPAICSIEFLNYMDFHSLLLEKLMASFIADSVAAVPAWVPRVTCQFSRPGPGDVDCLKSDLEKSEKYGEFKIDYNDAILSVQYCRHSTH